MSEIQTVSAGFPVAYLVYVYPVCAALTFGVWQHSLAAGLFLFFIMNVAAILRKG